MAAESDSFPIYVVDAFTSKPFGGNPAAVCLIGDTDLDDIVYQQIAAEMNLSETAFIRKLGNSGDYESDNCFALRWFTPKCEVALCGHATLASAAVIFRVLGNAQKTITFQTKSGGLNVRQDGDNFCLDMPQNKPAPVEKEVVHQLQKLITATVGALELQTVWYSETTKKLLLRLQDSTSRSKLENLSPNYQKMLECEQRDLVVRGVVVTVKGSEKYGDIDYNDCLFDFLSRYFAPWVGINEDPVTGSAHTVLASYWSAELHKTTMSARQCSKRGGNLKITLLPNDRVEISGPASIVLRGEIKHA